MHVASLADAVTPVLCLGVHGGIPVTVVEYDRVCTGQVHTDTARARRQDEAEDAPIHVETFHQCLIGTKSYSGIRIFPI